MAFIMEEGIFKGPGAGSREDEKKARVAEA